MNAWPLTARGTGAVALAVGFFILAGEFGVVELVYFGVLLLVVVAAALATLHLARRSETVLRSFDPDVSAVGAECAVTVRIEVRGALPAAQGRWTDLLAPGLVGVATGVFPALQPTAADRTIEVGYRVRTMRRGIRSVGPLTVVVTDPFGFARRRHVLGGQSPLTVTPSLVPLAALPGLPGEAGGSLHSATHQLGQGADNLIPRAYVPGDSMRRIHWRASAHHEVLMVRQEEQESTPEAIVVLDRSTLRWTREALQAPGEDPGFESALSACLSVVARLVHEGYDVSVVDTDGLALAEPVPSGDEAGVEELAIGLATLTARRDDHLADLRRVFATVTTGPLVVIVGRLDESDADLLRPVAARGSLPVLLAVSPQGDALARASDAGWRVATIGPDTDLATAWAGATDWSLADGGGGAGGSDTGGLGEPGGGSGPRAGGRPDRARR